MTGLMDAASAVTLKRFLLRVGLLALSPATLDHQQPARAFVGMIDLAALITCACAIFARNPVGTGPLNQWDEAVALLGVRCLAAGAGLFAG